MIGNFERLLENNNKGDNEIKKNNLESERPGSKEAQPENIRLELFLKNRRYIDSERVENIGPIAKENSNNLENKIDKNQVRDVRGILPQKDGKWSGEVGNSYWMPDLKAVPGDRNGTNPEGKTWGEIFKKYGVESKGILFKEGEPDFSEIAKAEVEIDDFTEDRSSNFDQADEKLAEKLGCTPEEVAKWRENNKYTWHECRDCKTMQLVPTKIHGNIPHSGGISEYKKNHNSREKVE